MDSTNKNSFNIRTPNNASSKYYLMSPSKEQTNPLKVFLLVNKLLRTEVPVFQALEPFNGCLAGDFLIPEKYAEGLIEDVGNCGVQVKTCKKPRAKTKNLIQPKIAVYYTGGYVWSLIHAYTLEKLGFTVRVCTANDVEKGVLNHFNVLTIPGGHSLLKLDPLTLEGRERLKQFIFDGGGCFATCGGAATITENGLGIVRAKRDRLVHGIHGPYLINITQPQHPIWFGYEEKTPIPPFYGCSFKVLDTNEVKVLGTYDGLTPLSYVWDYRAIEVPTEKWPHLEEELKLPSNPAKMYNTPAIIETKYGSGKIILSYPHPEAVDWEISHRFVANTIFYIASRNPKENRTWVTIKPRKTHESYEDTRKILLELSKKADHLSLTVKSIDKIGSNKVYKWIMKYDMTNPRWETFWSRLRDLLAFADECRRNATDLNRIIEKAENNLDKDYALILLNSTKLLRRIIRRLEETIEKLSLLEKNVEELVNLKKKIRQSEKKKFDQNLRNLKDRYHKLAENTFGRGGPIREMSPTYAFIIKRLDQVFYNLFNLKHCVLELMNDLLK